MEQESRYNERMEGMITLFSGKYILSKINHIYLLQLLNFICYIYIILAIIQTPNTSMFYIIIII